MIIEAMKTFSDDEAVLVVLYKSINCFWLTRLETFTCCSFHLRITSGSSFFSLGRFGFPVDVLVAHLSPFVDSSELSVDRGSSGGVGDTIK